MSSITPVNNTPIQKSAVRAQFTVHHHLNQQVDLREFNAILKLAIPGETTEYQKTLVLAEKIQLNAEFHAACLQLQVGAECEEVQKQVAKLEKAVIISCVKVGIINGRIVTGGLKVSSISMKFTSDCKATSTILFNGEQSTLIAHIQTIKNIIKHCCLVTRVIPDQNQVMAESALKRTDSSTFRKPIPDSATHPHSETDSNPSGDQSNAGSRKIAKLTE